MKWSMQRWNGWTGLTIDACWNRLEIFRQLNMKNCIMIKLKSQPWWLDSNKTVSGKPGAIQLHIESLCKKLVTNKSPSFLYSNQRNQMSIRGRQMMKAFNVTTKLMQLMLIVISLSFITTGVSVAGTTKTENDKKVITAAFEERGFASYCCQ